MAFVLKVISGRDEGKVYRVESGENLVGRSPKARILLKDESVAWEHASVHEEEGKVHLTNLSALGTKVRGRRVDDRTRLRGKEEIQLSDSCRLLLEERVGKGIVRSPRLVQGLILAIVLLVVIGGGLATILAPKENAPPQPGVKEWLEGYLRLSSRLDRWSDNGWFPAEGAQLFRDGWRLEQAKNYSTALGHWSNLRSLLVTAELPTRRSAGRTMSQLAGTTDQALRAVLGVTTDSGVSLRLEETYADALVWFVRYRADSCRRQVEKEAGR